MNENTQTNLAGERTQIRVVSAWTTHPNTPESDAMFTVEHTVKLSDGSTRTVFASDPPDAIAKVERIL